MGSPRRVGTFKHPVGGFLASTVQRGLGNAATIFAVFGVGFYLIGLGRRVRILEAEGVPTARGIPLTPLQDYLVQGLAVVLDPNTMYDLLSLIFVVVLIIASPHLFKLGQTEAEDWDATDPEDGTAAETGDEATVETAVQRQGRRRRALRRLETIVDWSLTVGGCIFGVAALLALGLFVLYLPPAKWAPGALFLVPPGLAYLAYRKRLLPEACRAPGWTPARARLTVVTFAAALGFAATGSIWSNPPVLDEATLKLEGGGDRSGALLATANNALYIVTDRPGQEGAAIEAYPLARLESFQIVEGSPRTYRALAHVVGLTRAKWPADVQACRPLPAWAREVCDALH